MKASDTHYQQIKIPKTKIGDIVEITSRKVSDKVQPHFAVGSRFTVEDIAYNDAGLTTLIVKHPTRKGATLRCSKDRFSWRIITPEMIKEEKFREQCHEDTMKICNEFTQAEQLKIGVVPLILNHIAWHYAFKAVEQSVLHRVQILKKLTRAVRELRKEYTWTLRKDLSIPVITALEEQTEQFIQECASDFTVFYFTVNGEFKKKMPTYPYDELRTYAIMSVLLIRYVDEHNRETDALIKERFGSCKATVRMPEMTALLTLMEAMAGEVGKFDYSETNVNLCMNILRNNINRIDFVV